MAKRTHPRDLVGSGFSPSDLVRNRDTIELAIHLFDAMLKAAQHDRTCLESFVRRTIRDMIEVGRITASSELYGGIINPFYKEYFGEDAPAFVLDRIRYRVAG